MKMLRNVSAGVLILITFCALAAPWLAPHPYDEQNREFSNSRPSHQFPLGTDEFGRDRLSRLLWGTGVSVALAPAAALTSIVFALLFSTAAPARSPLLRYGLSTFTTLSLSIPWIFPFIVLRSLLPLNTSPALSITLTFALIGFAGWAYPGRVFSAAVREAAASEWLLSARASGIGPWRLLRIQIWPHLRSTAIAQLRVLVPAYILSEAGLGLLGLGVAEPLPSWGNMLMELRHPDRIGANPVILAPLALLMLVMVCLEILGNTAEGIA